MALLRLQFNLRRTDLYDGKLGSNEESIKCNQENRQEYIDEHIKEKGCPKTALKNSEILDKITGASLTPRS